MKTLQSLRGQSLGFHFLNFSLNLARDSIAFISGGINSQILGPKYDPDSDLLNTVNLMCHILRCMSQMIMSVFS